MPRRAAAAAAAAAAPPAAEPPLAAGEKLLSLAAVEARLHAIAPLLDDGAEAAALVERARAALPLVRAAHSSHSGPLVREADWNACWKAVVLPSLEKRPPPEPPHSDRPGLLGGVAQLLGVGKLASLLRAELDHVEASSPPPTHRSGGGGGGGGGGRADEDERRLRLLRAIVRGGTARAIDSLGDGLLELLAPSAAAPPAGSAVASPLVAAAAAAVEHAESFSTPRTATPADARRMLEAAERLLRPMLDGLLNALRLTAHAPADAPADATCHTPPSAASAAASAAAAPPLGGPRWRRSVCVWRRQRRAR